MATMRVKCPGCEREYPVARGSEVGCSYGERFSAHDRLVAGTSRSGGLRFSSPFGPICVPQSEWDKTFEELEPVRRESDGRMLKRYRLRWFGGVDLGDSGPICTEDPMDALIEVGEVKLEPLKAPKSEIFFLGYTYGGKDPLADGSEE